MSTYDVDLLEGEPPPLPAEPTRYYPTHPLFPLPQGARETKDIAEITFDRWNEKGHKERCPDRFRAAELTSLAQVVDLFGGGTYQFIAFDSRGNFSRWTSEKDKVRIDLPSKPFRQVEKPSEVPPEAPIPPVRTATQPQPPGDYLALLMQQSMAAQERAEKQSMAAQERADRLLAVLVERLANPPQPPQPPPPPPAPPAPDPIAMLTGLAAVLDKLRPSQAGDMVSQLSGLVSIIKQLKGAESSEGSEDTALQPLLTMMTNAMVQSQGQGAATNPPGTRALTTSSAPSQAAQPKPQPDLVWVMVPGVGPALMRPDLASLAMSKLASAAPAPSTATQPTAPSTSAPASPPAPPPTVATPPTTTPSEQPAAPAPAAPAATAADKPADTSSAPPAASAEASPVATVPPARAERCIVCAEPGKRDPVERHILLCPQGHKSLMEAAPITGATHDSAAATVDATAKTSPSVKLPDRDQIDAMLADPEVLKFLPAEMTGVLRQVRAQMGSS